jgi:hypothetical protein
MSDPIIAAAPAATNTAAATVSPEHFIIAKSLMHQLLDPYFQVVSPETAAFIVIIAAFTVQFHVRFSPSIIYSAPAVLTTLGILGTFVGIALGLSNFNVNDVQGSVPALIDGIKTAVWASAWGIFCALTIKIREIIFGASKKYADHSVQQVTIDDLGELLASIQQSLVGTSEVDLLTHLEKSQQKQKEHLEKINQTLQSFGNQIVGGHSEAMIQALKEIVQEFNTKISAQFGDNFKTLNNEVKISNDESKNAVLGAIHHFNTEFNANIQNTVDQTKMQLAALEAEQLKVIETHGKELSALSQNLTRMIRQLNNNSMLTVK